MPENRASFGYCHSILIILGLATISIALIVSAFSLALINENNQILQDATFSHFDSPAKTDRKAMRVARCDVGVCTSMTTVTKTVWETSKVEGAKTRTMIALSSESSVVIPPGVVFVENEVKAVKTAGGGSRRRQIVDVNKPEMQM
ncbi:hypothetical protein D6D04_01674 [Aureobasidium pullulans]|nr:hypothetical protein D6D04_01674 [Aureobasidium pullulans]